MGYVIYKKDQVLAFHEAYILVKEEYINTKLYHTISDK